MGDLGRKKLPRGVIFSRDRAGELWRRAQAEAGRSHDVLTREELLSLGAQRNRIASWVRNGRLFRIYPGVYSVGTPTLSTHGRWLAAVRYGGPDAVLSHLSAAALWKLLERDPVVIDITAPRSRRSRDGVRVHRPLPQPSPAERCIHDGIPTTTPARTFFDLASMVSEHRLTDALRAGERHEDLDPASLLASLEPHRGRPGIALARRVLETHAPAAGELRSGLESEFWDLLFHDPTIRNPETNVWVAGYRVDAFWRRERLIVETDGGRWHGTSVDRVRDAARDATHRELGYVVLRFGDDDVEHRPGECLASVRAALRELTAGAGGVRSSPR
jgi:very-short-patch-repair endonuclease